MCNGYLSICHIQSQRMQAFVCMCSLCLGISCATACICSRSYQPSWLQVSHVHPCMQCIGISTLEHPTQCMWPLVVMPPHSACTSVGGSSQAEQNSDGGSCCGAQSMARCRNMRTFPQLIYACTAHPNLHHCSASAKDKESLSKVVTLPCL